MRPRLPPLNALKAFEAAARHESFTRAAEELCVTQGAVSHQVKALEAELAIKRSTGSPSAPNGFCSGRAPACSPSAPHPISLPNGWCTGSATLPRRMRAST
jgi:hypothetical protein